MYYAVKARFNPTQAAEFLRRLTDGTIQHQRPDGEEIVDSMQRARITEPGVVEWSEECYCDEPLAHERATVYDHFFANFTAREIDEHGEFEGADFMAFLRETAGEETKVPQAK